MLRIADRPAAHAGAQLHKFDGSRRGEKCRSIATLPIDHEAGCRHCQTKFYAACWGTGTRSSSTVFAHESPSSSANSEAENGLCLFDPQPRQYAVLVGAGEPAEARAR